MEQNFEQARANVLEQLNSRLDKIEAKLGKEGFVVAGFGGDTYYAFVGLGRGFQGAALTPISINPVIFSSEQAAQREANNGIYKNGMGDVIDLQVKKASEYFSYLHRQTRETLEYMKEMFAQN